MRTEIEIPLEQLLEIADKPLRKWLQEWVEEEPEIFPKSLGYILNMKISAKEAVNCVVILEAQD